MEENVTNDSMRIKKTKSGINAVEALENQKTLVLWNRILFILTLILGFFGMIIILNYSINENWKSRFDNAYFSGFNQYKTTTVKIYITKPIIIKSQQAVRAEIIRICKEMKLDSNKIEVVKSLAFRESSFRVYAFNPVDSSAGLFGETKRFVEDVNRISGKNYKDSYRYNIRWSIEMLVIYLNHYSDWTLENVCNMWHRSICKKENDKYYNQVVSEIEIARI